MNKQINVKFLMTAIAAIFLLGASHSTFAQAGSGAKYGSRDLTTCTDTKAPTKGAITPALAAQYARCTYEKADGNSIGLLEDLKIQVGGAVPFDRKTYPYATEVDVKAPVYPLRGSYKTYTCDAVSDAAENRGVNCTVYVSPKATGVCLKTTFGDWWCSITGLDFDTTLTEYKMPPPGGAKGVAAKDKPTAAVKDNNRTTAAKTGADANKDENGFPKPDFSEMEQYYEIVRYEYSITDRTFYFVAKMLKEVNPNDFEITYYDADGAKLMSKGGVVWSNGDLNYQPGDVHKFWANMPTESILKRVTKVVVTRHIY